MPDSATSEMPQRHRLTLPAPDLRKRALRRRLPILLLVAVPSAFAAIYLFFVASNQYVSEAKFLVRGAESPGIRAGGIAEILGVGPALGAAETEARAVNEYLLSFDAISALPGAGVDLLAMFRREGVDPLSRLGVAKPSPETLRRYFRGKVKVIYDTNSGVTSLEAHAFAPRDAVLIARSLLRLGEARINRFNTRANDAALAAARQGITEAEAELGDIQRRLTGFRDRNRDIDPASTSAAQQILVGRLEAEMSVLRTDLRNMSGVLPRGSPQIAAMEGRISALQRQIDGERSKLTGRSNAVAPRLADFEELKLQQQFAANRYEAARLALELAHKQALKQQLFVVSVVEPNLPVKSTAPKRLSLWATITFGLFLTYGIGWLLLAGVREHEA